MKDCANNVPVLRSIVERGSYSIRLISSTDDEKEANALIERMYAQRGYEICEAPQLQPHANQLILEARTTCQLVGTLTFRMDSELGLAADALYKYELDGLRAEGRKLAEFSKLAFDPAPESPGVLAVMISIAYTFARIVHGSSDVIMEVNPRHLPFYNRMLGAQQIGPLRTCQRVAAPAVLLHGEIGYMDNQVRKQAGKPTTRKRSLYSDFLPKREAEMAAVKMWSQLYEADAGVPGLQDTFIKNSSKK